MQGRFTMGSRIVSARSVAILGCFVLVAFVVIVLSWRALGLGPRAPRLTLVGGGTTSVGQTSVQYVLTDHGIALAIWCADTKEPSVSGHESGYLSAMARGFFSSADGKRTYWVWYVPRERAGDFRIGRTSYDLANGTLFLVSTK